MVAVVGRDPFAADEEVVVLPWSFPAWDFDWVAFHQWLAFLAPEGRLYQVEHPEGPAVDPGVVQVEAVAAVAFPVAERGLLVDLPDMD